MKFKKSAWCLVTLLKIQSFAIAMYCCKKELLKNINDRFITSLSNDFKQRFPVNQLMLNLNCSETVRINDLVRCELEKLQINNKDLWTFDINTSKNLIYFYKLNPFN